jgi:hypothetical protein
MVYNILGKQVSLKKIVTGPCIIVRDGSKTSKLCNRLILLDHNKINLVLIFYAL